jgi:quercetin dioxygenase-like cupin family protein
MTHVQEEWGELTWFANLAQGNSEDMTVGRCIIKPGFTNPLHFHPNCSEVLVVVQGQIMHTCDERGNEVNMEAGDAISIPPNFKHQARNIGDVDAILHISFSAADRQTIGE